jgi:methylenetetrahydrofolate--tRNA-(uracil-5-)-methyltransferase
VNATERPSGAGNRDPAARKPVTATIIGGGLAGSEAAWALAQRGVEVTLYEMRPAVKTPAHQTDRLAELVCSNSFKSTDLTNAHGLLKAELRRLGSLLLPCADRAAVPAGTALAVDRDLFSSEVHARLSSHPKIRLVREEAVELSSPGIVATGPLTSERLAVAIATRLGSTALAFFDAIAPIVSAESLDHARLYALSRYGKGEGDDYLNAPMTAGEYEAFIAALIEADQFVGHEFDQVAYFEGCLPVEEMARRGPETLRFGPMKPVGLPDPRTGREPHAVVQLRREDRAGQMWNLVGFQTRMKIPEQKRVFGTIPGLAGAEYFRFGSIHRNAYINSPASLGPALTARGDDRLFFAGQLTGVEGYTESLGTGLLAGINLARRLRDLPSLVPPATTMLGGLYRYLSDADPAHFQPMNANFGLLDPLDETGGPARAGKKLSKDAKKQQLVQRAQADFERWAARLEADDEAR